MNIIKMGLLLLFWASLAGARLSVVYLKTDKLITRARQERITRLQKEILPLAVKFEAAPNGAVLGYDPDGALVGTIVSARPKGYAGEMEMIVGADVHGRVIEVRISRHKETPGLGSKVADVEFLSQFSGKTAEEFDLKKDNANGKVDAISGATISSRAAARGVKEAILSLNVPADNGG